jgi:hypothetical protein
LAGSLTAAHQDRARLLLAGVGAAPHALARRKRPLAFADIVSSGGTFTGLFTLLRRWVDDEHAQWDVIRRKVRFVGVTKRFRTSPNTVRWHQHAPWARELPASAVVNVSCDLATYYYLADDQRKLNRSFYPARWLADPDGPGRSAATRQALAEAAALVAYGRSSQGRTALARAISGEPALAQPWLRSVVLALNHRT